MSFQAPAPPSQNPMTTDRHACGLSSFLPMSCRGRAEAFARRLQSRLQSLGRQPSDDPTDSEESWLTGAQHFPANHQPVRLSSSSDSDVFFDFDVDFGSPGSPLEEATEDIHLNQPRRCAPASCVTAVAASPGSDDSNYFDLEAPPDDADPDPCGGVAQWNGLDADLEACLDYSSNDTREDMAGAHWLAAGADVTDPEACLDYSSTDTREDKADNHWLAAGADVPDPGACLDYSSTDTREDKADTHWLAAGTDVTDPGACLDCSSTDTREDKAGALCKADDPTLDAHWLPAAGADVTDNAAPVHSCARARRPRVDYTKCNGVRHEHSTETHEAKTSTHEARADTHEAEVIHLTETHELDTKTHELATETHEAGVGNLTETHELDTETHEAKVEHSSTETHELLSETHEAEVDPSPETGEAVYTSAVELPDGASVYCSTLNVATHELLVEYPSPVPGVEITVAAEPAQEAAPRAAARDAGAARKLEVDDIDDEERPQRVRRCSSLKTGKTPPGTPGRKKIVRFADVLGLDLADVRTFLDEVPKVPTSAYEDLQGATLAAVIGNSLPKPDKTLVPMFVQPGGCADFFDRVREQQVCLENAVVSDVMLATISGTVRVRNLDFNKSVHIRYSVDGWKTFSDLQASYVQNSCDGFSDTFSFVLYAHTLTVGQRLEFAVRFQCHGCQYWDGNRGANYVFQCLPPAGQMSFRSHPMSTCPDEQWASFY